MTVGIIDVGIGNLGSLRSAVLSQGWDVASVTCASDMDGVRYLLLPGVGAFAAAMHRLGEVGLVGPIRDFAASGRPVMGICLGMQLLAEWGNEGGRVRGLGVIPGEVVMLQSGGLRLPHVGWNEVHQTCRHPILDGIRNDVDFYFVHSFKFQSSAIASVLAETEYGERFPSIIGRGNVVGVQFHPEKSQGNGLRMLDNFCLWDGAC